MKRFLMLPALLACALAASAAAQATPSDDRVADVISRWITLPAPAGAEEIGTARLLRVLPGFTRDAVGNLIRRVGSGSPRRVVACALDVSSYVVSEITDQGYIRLHRAGATPAFPLWDQATEAQRVRIFTARGGENGVIGVGAIFNGHFAQQHRADTTIVGVDQLWIDVGASSRADAERLGIALLDPVIADRPAWTYDGYAAGPAAGARAGCAAVATAAQGTPSAGETVFILSAQHVLNWGGLSGALARLGGYDELTLIGEARRGRGPQMRSIVPRTRFTGSLVESISAADARDLLARTATAAGVTLAPNQPWVAPAAVTPPGAAPRTDGYENAEDRVTSLLDIPAVHPHEWRVRNAVLAALPAWARAKSTVDSAGNVIVQAGPDRGEGVVFVAHMDEVGFVVDRILPDGDVALRSVGGAVASSWEGQQALLYFDAAPGGGAAPEPLRGVFVPRDTAHVKAPRSSTAWFGLDSAALVARGVYPGAMVIGYKHADRLGEFRLTGRSSDDRTGSAALLMAVRGITPAAIRRKTYFVWDVGEEAGLLGARAFGATHGTTLARTYAIDTFVSSDSPLELPTFAFAPLGKGPVLRGLDNSTAVSRAERDIVVRAARAANIPLQMGTTQGSTDGSAIGAYGAPNIGLSWPGRYSHTPGEVLDLRDLDALSKLVKALATTP